MTTIAPWQTRELSAFARKTKQTHRSPFCLTRKRQRSWRNARCAAGQRNTV